MGSPFHPAIPPAPGLRRIGTRDRTAVTINGEIRITREYHWAKGRGVYPADATLNIDTYGLSAGAREALTMLGMTIEFRGAMATAKRLAGINLCAETIRQVTLREAERMAAAAREGTLKPSFTPEQTATGAASQPGPTRLYLGADGVLVPTVLQREKDLRRQQHATRRAQRQRAGIANLKPLPTPRPGSDQRYKEMKLGYFYNQDGTHRHAFATHGDHKAFGLLLKEHAGHIGFDAVRERISLTDGAEWIRWQVYANTPTLTGKLLDFYHLSQHIHATAVCCMGDTPAAKQWVSGRLHEFKHRGAAEPLAAIEALGKQVRSRSKRESVRRLKAYITERLDMLGYPAAIARGWHIGSGPTEAMCKNLTLRLKQSGMKWDAPNAARIMNIIALYENCQAPAYWERCVAA